MHYIGSRFYWHWQNLKDDEPRRIGFHGRAWLRQRPRGVFGVEWHLPGGSVQLALTVGGVEDQLRLSISLWFVALYFSIENCAWIARWKPASSYQGKETSFTIHDWSLWWSIWHDEYVWHSKTPRWRIGSFNITDFFLGRAKYTKIDGESTPVMIPMPEGEYPAIVTFYQQTWKRPRWPVAKRRDGAKVNAGQGVPIPGKGENSWDCGEDAIFSSGSSTTTMEGAIQDFIASVMHTRERYGGKNWQPEKQRE